MSTQQNKTRNEQNISIKRTEEKALIFFVSTKCFQVAFYQSKVQQTVYVTDEVAKNGYRLATWTKTNFQDKTKQRIVFRNLQDKARKKNAYFWDNFSVASRGSRFIHFMRWGKDTCRNQDEPIMHACRHVFFFSSLWLTQCRNGFCLLKFQKMFSQVMSPREWEYNARLFKFTASSLERIWI